MSSQTIGTMKNIRKNTTTLPARIRPRNIPGVTAFARRVMLARVAASVAFKETTSEDEEDAQSERDDQQHERDRRRAIEVVLTEGVEEGELVE